MRNNSIDVTGGTVDNFRIGINLFCVKEILIYRTGPIYSSESGQGKNGQYSYVKEMTQKWANIKRKCIPKPVFISIGVNSKNSRELQGREPSKAKLDYLISEAKRLGVEVRVKDKLERLMREGR
jgi:hypothetical protein